MFKKYYSKFGGILLGASETERTIFERHMLQGEHFRFLNATYALQAVSQHQTRLTLITRYRLDTKINFYGELWGRWLLSDFQTRLIHVVKMRCEKIPRV